MDPLSSNEPTLLPQYGFGATYTFDVLVEHHHFLYRVHTPKHRGTLSRPSSPSPRPASPFASPNRPAFSRSPSSLSASVTSIRSTDSGPSDYFAFASGDEDDTAPSDPYFLSRRFKDDLSSPDPGQRRRTLSTLSTFSGGSGSYSYIGSDDGSEAESEPRGKRGGLSRSASMVLGLSRARSDSLSASWPATKRSQSADIRLRPSAESEKTESTEGAGMTYSDLVRHLDWTTRASSPYVTTSFSFFWCLWEAVRRYKLGVKHDVEIAVIDARKVRSRARTALEVLRSVEDNRQDKAYWKWYRFALQSQDVLVFGAIPGDAIYASIPLTQIMPKLPSYFFVDDVPKPIADPREPDASIDPRSPTVQTLNPIFPSTPSRPHTPQREREHERAFTAHLLSTLAWDVGTTLKPTRKLKDAPSPGPGKPTPRHTSHAEFCGALSAAFTKRTEADQLRDATTSAVSLAELLIEPWFRARCAEGAAYPFRHDDDESDEEKDGDADKMSESVCLGLAGDGCALEHSHDSSIQDALFSADKEEETEEEAARREAAAVLSELALSLARWPAGWWYAEHTETVETLIDDVVSMCVAEAARGVQARIAWGIAFEGERERKRTMSSAGSMRSRVDSLGLNGSLSGSGRNERRGREETRERSRSRSPFAGPSMKHVRRASEGSPSPKPWPSRESPYKPRARSPLGTTPALGPAIIIRPKSKPKPQAESKSESKPTQEQEQEQETGPSWSPTTPPPTPPRTFSLSDESLRGVSPMGRRSPPPPPPRSNMRPPSPSQSLSPSLASLDSPSPSPNSSPAASLSSSLLKRSIHRRADSVPGGWPGGEGVVEDRPGSPSGPQAGDSKGEEDDIFWDPTSRTQARGRPLSWTSSGMALGAIPSTPSSIAGSRKSSTESLRSVAQGSPSSSPSSSMLRPRSRTQSDAQARETLLTEVVQSALGFGAGAAAGSSGIMAVGSSLRLETTPSSPQLTYGSDRPLILTHHRRHSSHGHVETELSPVREVEQEDEAEAEKASLEESNGSVGSMGAVCGEGGGGNVNVVNAEASPITANELVSEPTQAEVDGSSFEARNESISYDSVSRNASGDESLALFVDKQSGEQRTVLQGSGSSTPRSERQRSRSGTLASIPEEDWAEWSLIEAPSASEYDGEAEQWGRASGLESSTLESDIPLPPSPMLEPSILADDLDIPRLGDVECSSAMEAGEDQASSTRMTVDRVPEITLSVDDSSGASSDIHVGDQTTVKHPDSDKPSLRTSKEEASKEEETSSTLDDSRRFRFPLDSALRAPLAKTRTFLRTFVALPVLNPFRLAYSGNRTSTPSPVFEDVDRADAYLRLSPLFSLFRIPFLYSRFLRHRGLQPARSMPLILAPPPAWDTPILETDSSVPSYDDDEQSADADDRLWDAHTTSWAMSCLVCGVMASLYLASIQQQRYEMHMLIGNRFH